MTNPKPATTANVFEYHRPNGEEIQRIEQIRAAYFRLLEEVLILTRPGSISGRYVALAKTALEEAAMWTTKSVVFERENEGWSHTSDGQEVPPPGPGETER
jgi:hypothetical protein